MSRHHDRNVRAFGAARAARAKYYIQLWLWIPWITYDPTGAPCDGLVASRLSGRMLWFWGPGRKNPPVGTEKARCKKTGHWRYAATGRTYARSGTYCGAHVSVTIGSMEELERLRRWALRAGSRPDAPEFLRDATERAPKWGVYS